MIEEKLKHLEFIQNVVTRMNTNSFQIKEWTVALASALLAAYVSTKVSLFILIAIFPTLIFWFLDAYYITQERKFRGLYNDVAGVSKRQKQIKLFEMKLDSYVGGKYCYCNVFWSKTICPLYLAVIAAMIALYVVEVVL